ncbi:MAG TPA: ATP-binding cassette domain-containing protein, partial [Phnomibacter sp.]|nr:ATP-binding cassette domain-containing protein [Phnomibacter sp.]
LTVGENVLLASQWVAGRQGPAFARQLMERLGVARHFKRQPRSLSQGEQQRVAIARALMNSPAVLLADEPTSSLDDDHAQEVINLLKEQSQQQGCLLVVVTHDSRLKTAFANQIALH